MKQSLRQQRFLLWLLLALPALLMISDAVTGAITPDELLQPTGDMSARLLIVALAVTPLAMLFPAQRWPWWLLDHRRALGVATFGYAALHLVFYAIDMETLEYMRDELGAPGIWTAWAALLLMLPLAITSHDAAMRWLGRNWKRLQRLAYPAALLTLAHWILVHNSLGPALTHFVPLAVLQLVRLPYFQKRRFV